MTGYIFINVVYISCLYRYKCSKSTGWKDEHKEVVASRAFEEVEVPIGSVPRSCVDKMCSIKTFTQVFLLPLCA